MSLAALVIPMLFTIRADWPVTRAERTNYRETSHYADVVQFLRDLQTQGAPVSVQMIGSSTEGRPIPLAIAAFPPVSSAAEARRSGKPIVYIQANIHAGEVEGKEASLILLRRLSQEGPKGLLGKMILLVTPIYNIDGNEKFGPVARNRPEQDGPDLVGVRPNGQGLDLNRDAMKCESPEMRAALERVYTTWDPDVMMDLHTTNGTRHGWELTYAAPNPPNTEPGLLRYSRDVLIPDVRRAMMAQHGLPTFDYGNAERRGEVTSWYTFGHEPRYCTNYVGLRNRIGILSEATTYIPFKARVEVTDKFVTAVLDHVAKNAKRVMQVVREADARVVGWGQRPETAPEMGVRFAFASRGKDTVLLEKPRPRTPETDTQRPIEIERVRMEVYDRFTATRKSRFPAAYTLPASATKTVELLLRHGIIVERFVDSARINVEEFRITKVAVAPRPFQGHRLVQLDGEYVFPSGEPKGTPPAFVIRTAQPLGLLAFHLLDPESDDGVVAWGHFGEEFTVGGSVPIGKIRMPVRAALERVTKI